MPVTSIYEVTGTETSSRLVETIAVTVRSSSASALGMMSEKIGMKENKNTDVLYVTVLMRCTLTSANQRCFKVEQWSRALSGSSHSMPNAKWNLSRVSHWNVYLVLKHAGLNEDSATIQQSKQSSKHLKTCISHYKLLRIEVPRVSSFGESATFSFFRSLETPKSLGQPHAFFLTKKDYRKQSRHIGNVSNRCHGLKTERILDDVQTWWVKPGCWKHPQVRFG